MDRITAFAIGFKTLVNMLVEDEQRPKVSLSDLPQKKASVVSPRIVTARYKSGKKKGKLRKVRMPLPAMPDLSADFGDDEELQSGVEAEIASILGAGKVNGRKPSPPPPKQPTQKEFVAATYSPSRENDEAGDQDNLPFLGAQ